MDEGMALVADIGRHSVRFGITGGGHGMMPRDVRRFSTSEHPTFTSALVSYLGDVGLQDARLPSVLAIAGAARGDLINPTGSRWYVSLSGVEAVLRARPRALNECAANALALTTLAPGAFTPLHGPAPREVRPGGNYLVIGTGTGLGVAALVTAGDRLVPVQSEAGHVSFNPATPDEHRFAEFCRRRGQPIDAETLLSAAGLSLAYQALSGGNTAPSAEEVTRGAARDPDAAAAVRLFAEHLGAFAGDLVLSFAAWDGVFLTGPIARAIVPQLKDPAMRQRLEAKSSFRKQSAELPVALVNRDDLELIGAAAAFGNA